MVLSVIFVTPTFPPENGWGGIGTYTLHTARLLERAGVKSTILSCALEGAAPDKYSISQNIEVLRYLPSKGDIYTAREAVKYALNSIKGGCDLIEIPEYEGLGIRFQEDNPEFPVVVRLHGDTEICDLANLPPWRRSLRRFQYSATTRENIEAERRSAKLATSVSAPTDWTLQMARRRGFSGGAKSEWLALPNPFTGMPQVGHSIDASRADVLFLGRLDFRKGAHLIPGVAKYVWQKAPNTIFKIIGQSTIRRSALNKRPYAEHIMSQIPDDKRDNIILLGGIPYDEILPHLKSSKVAFFASQMETFGYTHIEAMSTGVASVVASGGGAAETFEDGVSALRANLRAHDISERILKLLSDKILLEKIASFAPTFVDDRFNSPSLIQSYVEFYKRATSNADR